MSIKCVLKYIRTVLSQYEIINAHTLYIYTNVYIRIRSFNFEIYFISQNKITKASMLGLTKCQIITAITTLIYLSKVEFHNSHRFIEVSVVWIFSIKIPNCLTRKYYDWSVVPVIAGTIL